jgi:hypothetical protein
MALYAITLAIYCVSVAAWHWMPAEYLALETAQKYFSYAASVYAVFMNLRICGLLNHVIQQGGPNVKRFNFAGALLSGELYLQYHLNQSIVARVKLVGSAA